MPAEDTDAARPEQAEATGQANAERPEETAEAAEMEKAAGAAGVAEGAAPGDRQASESPESPESLESPEGVTVRDPVSAPDAEGRPRRFTRRFPLFTRDTARPEGGGRAASNDAPAPVRQWPVFLVVGLVGIGLLITGLDVFRWGLVLVGAALLIGAVLRWFLPDVGMLAVRSRFTDIVTYGVLGTAIAILALMAQPDPLLGIPFLKDLLHFTVSS